MDGRPQLNIGCHSHIALMLLGHNVIREREALTGIKTLCCRFAGKKRLEQIHLLFSCQSKSVVLDFYPQIVIALGQVDFDSRLETLRLFFLRQCMTGMTKQAEV